jgi:hypothetical protein
MQAGTKSAGHFPRVVIARILRETASVVDAAGPFLS